MSDEGRTTPTDMDRSEAAKILETAEQDIELGMRRMRETSGNPAKSKAWGEFARDSAEKLMLARAVVKHDAMELLDGGKSE